MSDKKAKWYEVLEPSYIGDRLYPTGERVQYEGEAGPNLRELSTKELRDLEKQDQDEEEPSIDEREQELNEREEAVAQREKDADERVKELDARDEALTLREQELADDADKPLENQNVAELRETAKELGVEVPEGATKVVIRDLIKAKQAE